MGMCAANDASTFDFDFGYQTVPGLSCNVWHRPPIAPDFGGAGRPHEFGVIADSFCMSRNPYDRLSSQYRYKSTLDPEKFPPTCRAFGDFLDEHIDRMQDNALVRCLHKGAVSPSECQYHIRARLTREKELSMEEIDELSTYSDEDCHFLPQTMYTRACQNVFKLEEYETAVAPFLEKALHLPRGAASASEETRVLARLGAFRDANDVDEDDWKAEQDAAADAWRDAQTGHGVARTGHGVASTRRDPPSTDHDSETRRDVASDPRSALEYLTSNDGWNEAKEASRRAFDVAAANDGVLSGAWAQRVAGAAERHRADGAWGAAAPVDRHPALPAACSWADLRPETLARVVKTYADDFEELGYSSAPPSGVLNLGRGRPGSAAATTAASLGADSMFPGAAEAWRRQHRRDGADENVDDDSRKLAVASETSNRRAAAVDDALEDAVAAVGVWRYDPANEPGPESGWDWITESHADYTRHAHPPSSPPPPPPAAPGMGPPTFCARGGEVCECDMLRDVVYGKIVGGDVSSDEGLRRTLATRDYLVTRGAARFQCRDDWAAGDPAPTANKACWCVERGSVPDAAPDAAAARRAASAAVSPSTRRAASAAVSTPAVSAAAAKPKSAAAAEPESAATAAAAAEPESAAATTVAATEYAIPAAAAAPAVPTASAGGDEGLAGFHVRKRTQVLQLSRFPKCHFRRDHR